MSHTPPTPAPVVIGVLYDFPQADGGASFEEALRLGLATVETQGLLDRGVELLSVAAKGLPAGTAHDVEQCFARLIDAGALVAVGPSISDNGLIVGPMADRAGMPCINYTGGEQTRGPFMFHYPVGSLAEEPVVLVGHLLATGSTRVAALYDNTPVGRGYADFFKDAAATAGLELCGEAAVAPLADDVTAPLSRLAASEPDSLVYLGLGVVARSVALGVAALSWKVRVVANSSLMFGYGRRDWRDDWEGWVYVDTISDHNGERSKLAAISRRSAAGPIGVAAYDIGRLIGEGLARTNHLTRDGLREALERVKLLPAASGLDGTLMGFGHYDHGALKGRSLVLRRWQGGRSVEVEDQ
jgi:branched-chain amino acid transport system substrate-binding protein